MLYIVSLIKCYPVNLSTSRVSVQVPAGKLVAVVGMVGSGKSSLLSAMLGEMYKQQGTVAVQVILS